MNLPKLKGVCAEKEISRDEFGFIIGCGKSKLSAIWTGKKDLSLVEAQRFARAAELTDEEKVKIFLSD